MKIILLMAILLSMGIAVSEHRTNPSATSQEDCCGGPPQCLPGDPPPCPQS